MAKSQTEAIVEHLRTYGHITQLEATKRYGTQRLGSIIHNLRHKMGFGIETEKIHVTNRYGTTSSPAIYHLIKDVEELYND